MKKGFTLIELLVTISIIAILTGFSLTAFNGTKASARDGKRKADLEYFRSALELYRSDNSSYPTTLTALTGPVKYIDSVIPDPQSPAHVYSYRPTCVGTVCSTYVLCAGLELVTSPADSACTTAGASCGTTCTYHTSNP